ncbi:MAG: M50 family metallopeptidase [Pirellulales bacterium]|nr:M50 family metallopeptidase [Pirellulales bacterium]
MFLANPPPTQYDLHFRLLGFPVRVHPFFWIMALILGLGGTQAEPTRVLIWIIAVFMSILVHELGHALAIRWSGGHARIVLHGFGGMAIEEQADRSSIQQMVISVAGPAAGFVFGALLIALMAAFGLQMKFRWALIPVIWVGSDQHIFRDQFLWDLLCINIAWGLINLLPIYPLDGGQITRELFLLGKPQRGIILSLWISLVTALAVALYAAVIWRTFFMAFFFGYLAYSSYQTLQAYQNRDYWKAW